MNDKERTTITLNLQTLAILLSIILGVSALLGTFVLLPYRVDQVEIKAQSADQRITGLEISRSDAREWQARMEEKLNIIVVELRKRN